MLTLSTSIASVEGMGTVLSLSVFVANKSAATVKSRSLFFFSTGWPPPLDFSIVEAIVKDSSLESLFSVDGVD